MTTKQNSEIIDHWEHFRYFLGEWQGTGAGKPGVSRSERKYELVLNDQFIQINNRSVYEPQEANPDGEIHTDLGFFSYDKSRKAHILREFHVEGFVNQYIMEDWDLDKQILVMTTEAIENIPPGWSARTTYEIINDDEFRETFDLAGPEKDLVSQLLSIIK